LSAPLTQPKVSNAEIRIPRTEEGNRDREKPCGSSPPTPPGIRITYHGGSVD
jgi:hypothetical protein